MNAFKAVTLLGDGAFLPVHWGTFALAMHPSDQPAEVLLELSSKSRARLMMPRLGEPMEPTLASGRVEPWWRAVDSLGQPPGVGAAETRLSGAVPWPID